ncbi:MULTISPECIES: YlmH/Sll1252 family protein [unclassified Dehalobacter]|uniref:YlmH family RNA-binding protein n=1 Tax=unclassified Dehalobacter TaxID=2635733 RepID=UPI000E6CDA92|nr:MULTISPECIES: YlmH/Sll1252 family protein [unclassified Dehalobacter]RJE47953.1 RNA-binding protein [Dehalobacter sp. MCB1]TCX50639.1 RNA-binding protein [Dehalobacter sp. 14DCB1]TCX52117.1 RNA-binding protein [Dehalobacter sp. 12DCB1]
MITKAETVKKYAQDEESRLLLARALDKLEESEKKNIPACTRFCSEQQRVLLGNALKANGNPRYFFWGGYEGAERTVLIFLPDYLEPEHVIQDDEYCPLAFIRAEYTADSGLSHRDFLGSLMGAGIKRETVGDILVGENSTDLIVLKEILPFLINNLESVGRVKIKTAIISAGLLQIPEEKVLLLKDTVASLRLDSVVAAGFNLSRTKAGEYVESGKVMLNSLACDKTDKTVAEGDTLSLRGLGKIKLQEIGGLSKKGRQSIVIKKYV